MSARSTVHSNNNPLYPCTRTMLSESDSHWAALTGDKSQHENKCSGPAGSALLPLKPVTLIILPATAYLSLFNLGYFS